MSKAKGKKATSLKEDPGVDAEEAKRAEELQKRHEMIQECIERAYQLIKRTAPSEGAGKGGARDWSKVDPKEGPVVLEDGEEPPPLPDQLAKRDPAAPTFLDDKTDLKKQKELKKKAEKEAKMAKFQAKKDVSKVAPAKGKAEEAAKAKPEKSKPSKEKGPSAAELLKEIEKTPVGEKKGTEGKMPDAYDPKYVEAVWYPWWVKQGYFKPEYGVEGKGKVAMQKAIKERGKFVMVIPPPNVTGTLHLGHAIMCTLEDVLTRWNRMVGKVTLWVPGCDHAGIATQMVVEKTLARKEGLSRHDLGREEFTKRVWEWKEQKGDRIYEQLKRMGISADWDRVSFTMDPKLSKAVMRAFVNLFEWGYIYRADRLVNWSCTLQSCISDIEVDKVELPGRTLMSVPGYKDKVEFGVITTFVYKIDAKTEIAVATTRPETMLGDVAVAVHPEDKRYAALVGKKAKHPFVDREILIIADDYVDREFGTGAVKITPAHDPNDYEIGKRNNLPFITVIDENGNMMNNCGKFSGMKRFDARKAVVKALQDLGHYREAKDNAMVIPVCSRSKDIVEPLLKPQWYVSCSKMAKEALEFEEREQLRILPEMHVRTWRHWMEGIRDWCISRQLWWGHQIPAYKVLADGVNNSNGEEVWVAGETEAEAMQKAKEKFPKAKNIKLQRDEDVLDTWFSSGLFPFSVFGWPDVNSEDFQLFYPTDLLETGHDILFFWVARMVFMASTLTKEVPFKDVFLHSIVRDAHGRKMSKSLGNVIDPLDVIRGITLPALYASLEEGNLDPKEVEKAKQGQKQDYPNGIPECGTDALRFALCASMTQGRDINLDVLRVQGYRFFCNKLWNAVKFSLHYFSMGGFSGLERANIVNNNTIPAHFDRMDRWILGKLSKAIRMCNESLAEYNFQESTTAVYNFWLYELCDVYLESLKPKFFNVNESSELSPSQKQHLDVLLTCVETGLRLLSPFMPFLSEELWQRLPIKERSPSICVASYPSGTTYKIFESETNDREVSFMNDAIHVIRSARSAYNLPNKTKTEAYILNSEVELNEVLLKEKPTVCALAYTSEIHIVSKREQVPQGTATAVVSDKCTIFIPLKGIIDFEMEKERISKQLLATTEQLAKLEGVMNVESYEERVPAAVREKDAAKLVTSQGERKQLEEALQSVLSLLGHEGNSSSDGGESVSGAS